MWFFFCAEAMFRFLAGIGIAAADGYMAGCCQAASGGTAWVTAAKGRHALTRQSTLSLHCLVHNHRVPVLCCLWQGLGLQGSCGCSVCCLEVGGVAWFSGIMVYSHTCNGACL